MLFYFRPSIIKAEVTHINTLKMLESMKTDGIEIKSNCLCGEYKELCDLIGYEAVEKIYRHYCGGYISLPKKLFADDFVHGYIIACYHNGRKAKEIAREYDYTYSWVMKIIRRDKSNNI